MTTTSRSVGGGRSDSVGEARAIEASAAIEELARECASDTGLDLALATTWVTRIWTVATARAERATIRLR